MEKRDRSGIIDAVTRLSCEVGIPKIVLMDKDSALLKAMLEVELDFRDAQCKLNKEWGIEFSTCSVSGHNEHGQVERRIRTVQESLSEAGLQSKTLHATGLQTLLKLIENQLNNLPIGYSYGRDSDNTPLLKILSPNMLRIGRNNSRSLDGPMKLPTGGELLNKVEELYECWFQIWNASYIPKLLFQPKWFKRDRDLEEGNIVLFQKKESQLDLAWTLGTVDQLIRGRDKLARRAIIKYQNANEDFPRFSDRSTRSLVKIWSIDDQDIHEDLSVLHERLLANNRTSQLIQNLVDRSCNEKLVKTGVYETFQSSNCVVCYCSGHCKFTHTSQQEYSVVGLARLLYRYSVDLGLSAHSLDIHFQDGYDGLEDQHSGMDDNYNSLTEMFRSLDLVLD